MPASETIIDIFPHIIDPQNRSRWSPVSESSDLTQTAFVLNQERASPSELEYYKFRMTAHKLGLEEKDFANQLKRGQYSEHHAQFRDSAFSLASLPRAQRARMTPFSMTEELAASRFARFSPESVPDQVLTRRLEKCGLSRAGSREQRWTRLKEHVYAQTPAAFFSFCLERSGRPRSELELMSKMELFNTWTQTENESEATNVHLILDAWQHSPEYTSQDTDVSDLTLQSNQFDELVQEHVLGDLDHEDPTLTQGLKYALRPPFLKAVTKFYGFGVSDDVDYKTLLKTARNLDQNARRSTNVDVDPYGDGQSQQPHWATVINKCKQHDVTGALFSAGYYEPSPDAGTNTMVLKRLLRNAGNLGLLPQEHKLEDVLTEF